MNRKILTSGFSILASLALAGGATFAFFTDTAVSSNNVFSTGSLNLKLTDSNESVQDNVTASFGGTDMSPGVCLAPATLNLQNNGTVAGNHVNVSLSNSNAAMAPFLNVQTLTYDGNPVSVTDSNLNGYTDLADIEANGIPNLSLTNLSTDHPLVMQVCLHSTADNTAQGASDSVDLTALLTQAP